MISYYEYHDCRTPYMYLDSCMARGSSRPVKRPAADRVIGRTAPVWDFLNSENPFRIFCFSLNSRTAGARASHLERITY